MKNSSFLIAFFTIIVRYYDYSLFGLSAAILSKTFIPIKDFDSQLLGFFCIFSLSVIAKPVGSIIFGLIADTYGRVKALKNSIIVAAFATSIIAMLPSFKSIGWWAVLGLTISRMLFLMSLAGEVDTIRIYIAEKIDKAHKNTLNGVASFFTQVGALLAATTYYFASLNQSSLLWRVNFLIGSIGAIVLILLRRYFKETEEFLATTATCHPQAASFSFSTVLRQGTLTKNFIAALLINGCIGGMYNFCIIFFCTFASEVASIINLEQAKIMNIALIIIYAISSLVSGILADRIKRLNLIYSSIVCGIIVVLLILLIGNEKLFIFYPFFAIALLPFCAVPLQIKIQSLFDVRFRVRMCALSHSLGSMLLSSTTPLVCMILWKLYNSISIVLSFLLIQFFILFIGVVSIKL